MDPNSHAPPNASPGTPDPRTLVAAGSQQQQPAFLGWAVQPTTTYQLIPLDGTYLQYQPVFAQQPVSVPVPVPQPVTPVTPLRRQVSIGILQPAPALGPAYEYYQAAASSPQAQGQVQGQQPPQQQQTPQQQPAPPPNQTYTCSLVFTTPPPPPPPTMTAAAERPLPPSPLAQPATLPRTSLRRVSSAGIARQLRPRALSLASEDYPRPPAAASPVRMPRRRPGVAVPSNGHGNGGGYDGDTSSYSTSPLGSDFEHHAAAAASFRAGRARRPLRSWNRRSVREASVGTDAPTTSRATQHDGDAERERQPPSQSHSQSQSHPDDGISTQLEALHLGEDVGKTSRSAQQADNVV